MTVDEAIALGTRAVKAGWAWKPGCLAANNGHGLRLVVNIPDSDYWIAVDDINTLRRVELGPGWIPDFSDAATYGVLEAQVKGNPGVTCLPEALVSALEAASSE